MKKIILPIIFLFLFIDVNAQVKKGFNKNASLIPVKIEDYYFSKSNFLAELITQKNADYVITSEHISSVSGTHHVYIRQAISGIEVLGTESSLHFDKNKNVINSHNNFINDINSTKLNSTASISAEQAITSVAQQMNYSISNLQKLESSNGINKTYIYNRAGISETEIPIRLVYYYQEVIGTKLVWEMSIKEVNSSNWWNFYVDASDGYIIDKDNWTVSCNILGEHNHEYDIVPSEINEFEIEESQLFYTVSEEIDVMVESYRVFAMPLRSPYSGGRTLVVNPADATASPNGWHDTGSNSYTYTRGNNVRAYDDDNNTNSPSNQSDYAEGGAGLTFDFPLDAINGNGEPVYATETQSEDAAVTNVFYWSNIIHDVLYHYGFDEAAGNFQENNFGNGGNGSDSVDAECQDGSGTCNANFGTPGDGGNPRMQMYTCANRDADYDNEVIIHEYGHGISNRLTGGPAASGCLQNQEQMGEGWSDFYGLMLTMVSGENGDDARGMGNWLDGSGVNGVGIRTHPYSTDFAENPHTYDDIKTEVAPHGVGSVWAMMLFEMTWDLINVYGFDPDIYNGTGGNNIALNLVTEGMKLQGCSPGFVDGRDAILNADNTIYGGANRCIIWTAFAKRGLGASASQGSSNSKIDGSEAFDLPSGVFGSYHNAPLETLCITEGIQTALSGGSPAGGVYSGPGVTDNGNGTYDFNPTIAGIGTANVTYTVLDCNSSPVNLVDTIVITDGNPMLVCQNVTVTLDGAGDASIIWEDVVANKIPATYSENTVNGNNLASFTGGATNLNLGEDEASSAIPIGFDFDLFDTTYNQFYIHANGFVSFNGDGLTGANSWTPTLLPSSGVPNGIIAVVWDDLSPQRGGSIKYEMFGTAPNRKMVVEYLNILHYANPPNNSETISAQMHIYEGTNIVEIHTIDIQSDGGTRTLGIENSTGTVGVTNPVTNNGNWSAGAYTISFTPVASSFANNCGNTVSFNLDQSAFTCKDIGDNIVTITADDGNGGISTCNATVTVVGPTTTWNGSWDNGTPNVGTKAVFNSNFNTSSNNIDACLCEVGSSSTVVIEPGDYFKIEGNVTVKSGGTLTIEHEGSLVQVDDNALVKNNGTIEVNKTTPSLPHNMFSILGSPMTSETRDGVFVNSTVVMNHTTSSFSPHPDVTTLDPDAENFADDNGDNWSFYTGSEAMAPGVGYLVGPPSGGGAIDVTHTQGTLNNGIIPFTAVYNIGGSPTQNQNASPNILSNPYASAIDAYEFVDHNALVDAIYYWEHITTPTATYPGYRSENWDMGDISMYNLSGGMEAPNEGTDPKPSNQYLASGQGFGIKANGAGTVSFNNSMRLTGNNDSYRNNEVIDRLYLKVENPTYHLQSGSLIAFTEDATDGIDAQYDANRLATPVSIYSVLEEKELAIQGRSSFSNDQIVPLGFRTMVEEPQIYTISLSSLEGDNLSEATVYLKDNLLNTMTNLLEESYTFTSNESNQKDRFVIVFTEEVLGNNDFNEASISIYPNPTQNYINVVSPITEINGITIYDVSGRQIQTIELDDKNTYQLDMSRLDTSIYFIRIQTQNGSITKRIIKK